MKKANLSHYFENQEVKQSTFSISSILIPLRPIPYAERGKEILEEILSLSTQSEEEDLDNFFQEVQREFGELLVYFVALKFGIVTSANEKDDLRVMEPELVARRILGRYRMGSEDFCLAFCQVLMEEKSAALHAPKLDLHDFEHATSEEVRELSILSGNPAFLELLKFADDLDGIFQQKAFLFSYLEHRYSEYFRVSSYTPQNLAVQIALDYLSYREHYQLGILNDYEKLLAKTIPQKGSKEISPKPSVIQ